jgi:ribosome-binding ATPase
MKIGLVGYQGGGKSTVFQLLTGDPPDLAKVQDGQPGTAVVPDPRFDGLCGLYKPKKEVPATVDLLDTPGLVRDQPDKNAKKLAIIRTCDALVQIVGLYAGGDPLAEVDAFHDDLVLADLAIVGNRVKKLETDSKKPRPDRAELAAELDALRPILAKLEEGESLLDFEFDETQEKACGSFALLTRKRRLLVLNTTDATVDEAVVSKLEAAGHPVLAAPLGLELEVAELDESERAEFAAEMGLGEPARERLLRKIYEVTGLLIFYTSDPKEVHAWPLRAGSTAIEAAHAIHSDLARGFIRAEVMAVDDLLRLGSERELKAAGLHHVVGKDYVVKDGDEIVIRSGV